MKLLYAEDKKALSDAVSEILDFYKQTGSSGRVPVPPEKRFLINCPAAINRKDFRQCFAPLSLCQTSR